MGGIGHFHLHNDNAFKRVTELDERKVYQTQTDQDE